MPSNESEQLRRVTRLYDVIQSDFEIFWSRDYLRFGLWEDQTRTIREAVLNTDRFVAELLEFSAPDVVCDAGCGVGASAIYFAKQFGVRVVGVNICASQLKKAARRVEKAGLGELVRFVEQDFCQMDFPDASFSKQYAIESMYHVDSIARFANEAYRVLQPNGRLVVVDHFLQREDLNAKQQDLLEQVREGQAVGELATFEMFEQHLRNAGFSAVRFVDKLTAIQKGIARSHLLSVLSFPFSATLAKLRLFPREVHNHTVARMAARQLFAQGIMTYAGVVAQKS